MRNRTYGGVRGQKTKVGRKLLLRFLPTRFCTYRVGVIFYMYKSQAISNLGNKTILMFFAEIFVTFLVFVSILE